MSDKRDKPHITDQGRAFIEAARELGCDEDEERFNEALRRIGRAKPKPEPPPDRRDRPAPKEKKPPR